MPSVKQKLSELLKVDGVNTAVVVGRDGFVIDGLTNGAAMDVEAIGAVISTGVGTAEVMGRELKVGAMSQGMMEYKDGIILMSFLGREAITGLRGRGQREPGQRALPDKEVLPRDPSYNLDRTFVTVWEAWMFRGFR